MKTKTTQQKMKTAQQIGIETVLQSHGSEVVENMQHNPEDAQILTAIGNCVNRLNFLRSSTLTCNHPASSCGIPVLVSADGTPYKPSDITPCGEKACKFISENFNSIQMDLPEGFGRCQFADSFR